MPQIAHVEVEDGPQLKCFRPAELAIGEGDECIVSSSKILEFGKVIGLEEAADLDTRSMPKVLRRATLQDQSKATENRLMSKMAKETCQKLAETHEVEIRLVRVRYSFDRAALMVLYSSSEKLDTRDLTKELGTELRTRVEMTQLGVRDEAGIIGGMGTCGRKLCCCSWLHRFESINVRMAKAQRLSLNPGAISGMCGRLKCCLRYEYDVYRDMDRNLPREGTKVECRQGHGCVIDKRILSQKLRIRLKDDRIVDCCACDVTRASDHPKPDTKAPKTNSDKEST